MTDRDAWEPSDERLAAIRERESKATPGPWTGDPEPFAIYIYGADGSMVADTNVPGKYGDPDDRAQPNFEDGERGGIDAVLRLRGVSATKHRPEGSMEANYAFMIHARDDVRWLLGELTTAQAVLAAARAEVEALRKRERTLIDCAHSAYEHLANASNPGPYAYAALTALEPVRLWSYPVARSATKPAGEQVKP